MEISEIINTVAHLSLNEDDPDTDAETRILRYINLGYSDVYKHIAPLYTSKYVTSQSATISSGSATLATEPHEITRVVDTTNERVLELGELDDIVDQDPALTTTGSPDRYYITSGTTINVWPKQDVNLTVYYIPTLNTLTSSTAESDIRIPLSHQDILLEAALYYMYLDERDLTDAAALNNTQNSYENKLTNLKQFLFKTNKQRPGELSW